MLRDMVYQLKKELGNRPPPGGGGQPPIKNPMTACEGKEEGDMCEYGRRPDKGLCKAASKGKDGKMIHWCARFPPTYMECAMKEVGDNCTGVYYGKKIVGKCEKAGSSAFKMCRLPKMDPPYLEACKGKKDGDTCEYGATKGICIEDEKRKTTWCRAVPPSVRACSGKENGEECVFEQQGKKANGTCSTSTLMGKNISWCKQEGGSTPGKKPPHVAACEGKKAKDACQYSYRPGMSPMHGMCMTYKGETLYCRRLPPPVFACLGKDEGDACKFSQGARTFNGTCAISEAGGNKLAWCKYQKEDTDQPKQPPTVVACDGKDEGSACSFKPNPNLPTTLNGECSVAEKGGKKILWCRPHPGPRPTKAPAPMPPTKAPAPKPKPIMDPKEACDLKDEGDECEFGGMSKYKGKCVPSKGLGVLVCYKEKEEDSRRRRRTQKEEEDQDLRPE